ncbi:hypothetical protein [Tateyamaria sp. SN6-1]|uniref:hypothetical protein n=1 Tax=Tateyamaria sp. SN6-1 TaxID=3092148 RepID=UPI0039F48545
MEVIVIIDLVSRIVAIIAGGFSIWLGVDRIKSKAKTDKSNGSQKNLDKTEEEGEG